MKYSHPICWLFGHKDYTPDDWHICPRCGMHEYWSNPREHGEYSEGDYYAVWGGLSWIPRGWHVHADLFTLLWSVVSSEVGTDYGGRMRTKLRFHWNWHVKEFWRYRVFGFIPRMCRTCGRRFRECPDDEEHNQELPF